MTHPIVRLVQEAVHCSIQDLFTCALMLFPHRLADLVKKIASSLDRYEANSPYPSRLVSRLKATEAQRREAVLNVMAAQHDAKANTASSRRKGAAARARGKTGSGKTGTRRSSSAGAGKRRSGMSRRHVYRVSANLVVRSGYAWAALGGHGAMTIQGLAVTWEGLPPPFGSSRPLAECFSRRCPPFLISVSKPTRLPVTSTLRCTRRRSGCAGGLWAVGPASSCPVTV
jgi:hypothetical protein